jgi:hypothetical protein
MTIFFDQRDKLSKEVWAGWNGNPNYGWEDVAFFFTNNSKTGRYWPLDWRGCFGHGLKWYAPSSSLFVGLWAWPLIWRLHTMPGQRLQFLYFIGYFQSISLDSQQILAIQSHGLSTWTTIVRNNPNYVISYC